MNLASCRRLNPIFARSLRWGERFDQIITVLGFNDHSPGADEFAEAVAQWQSARGMKADGVLGPNTWSQMEPETRFSIDLGRDPAWIRTPIQCPSANTAISTSAGQNEAMHAVDTFLQATLQFANSAITDAGVRREYIARSRAMADELLAAYGRGEISARQAAEIASSMRNEIMDWMRLRSSDLGRAMAEQAKAQGKSLAQLTEYYALRLFNRSYHELSAAQKNQVALKIVESAGRPNPAWTARAMKYAKLGKALWFMTAAIAVYNVASAENPAAQAVGEGVGIGGGIIGGALGGGAAGLVCGPGAPVCVAVGIFVGGVLGAIGADAVFDSVSSRVSNGAQGVADYLNRAGSVRMIPMFGR